MDKDTKKYIDSKIDEIIDSGNRNFRQTKKDVINIKIRLKKLEDSL